MFRHLQKKRKRLKLFGIPKIWTFHYLFKTLKNRKLRRRLLKQVLLSLLEKLRCYILKNDKTFCHLSKKLYIKPKFVQVHTNTSSKFSKIWLTFRSTYLIFLNLTIGLFAITKCIENLVKQQSLEVVLNVFLFYW